RVRGSPEQSQDPHRESQPQPEGKSDASGEEQRRRHLHQPHHLAGGELQRPPGFPEPAVELRQTRARDPGLVVHGKARDDRRADGSESAAFAGRGPIARTGPRRRTAVHPRRSEERRGRERGGEQRSKNRQDLRRRHSHTSTLTTRRMARNPAPWRTTTATTSRYP